MPELNHDIGLKLLSRIPFFSVSGTFSRKDMIVLCNGHRFVIRTVYHRFQNKKGWCLYAFPKMGAADFGGICDELSDSLQ